LIAFKTSCSFLQTVSTIGEVGGLLVVITESDRLTFGTFFSLGDIGVLDDDNDDNDDFSFLCL